MSNVRRYFRSVRYGEPEIATWCPKKITTSVIVSKGPNYLYLGLNLLFFLVPLNVVMTRKGSRQKMLH
jgi:hypothetical protein